MAKQRGLRGMNWRLWGGVIAGGASLIPLVTMIRRRAMRVTTILKKDHRIVSGLIRTVEITPKFNGMVRKSLFNQIHQNVMTHAQAEEEVFYPAVRNVAFGRGDMINEAYREHETLKNLLEQMKNIDPMRDEFDNRLAELKSKIEHHVQEEESEIFQLCESRMSAEQLRKLGQQLHTKKKEIKIRMAA